MMPSLDKTTAPEAAKGGKTLFTARGWSFLALCAYLITGPGRSSADVVATTFAYCSAAVLWVGAFFTLLLSTRIKKSLRVEVSLPERMVSTRVERPILRLSPLRLFPFFSITLTPLLEPEQPRVTPVRLSGCWEDEHFVPLQVQFPHRGMWTLRETQFLLRDALGLCSWSFRMRFPQPVGLTVEPPWQNAESLPIISSTSRSGEEVPDLVEWQGEPFDIKPYHPSDGTRKILWKIFSKTGQLLSRHAERSITPEGETLLFCLAGPSDDEIAALSADYVRRLQELDLKVVFGCEGMKTASLAGSAERAKLLLIESAWSTSDKKVSADDLSMFIARLTKDRRVDRVVIFATVERLTLDGRIIRDLSSAFSNASVAPVIMSVGERRQGVKSSARTGAFPQLKSLFIAPPQEEQEDRHVSSALKSLLLSQGWEMWEAPPQLRSC